MAKQQILLVDADSSSARLLEVSLRSAGFTVATADSAENALAKLEHGTPDLILTDTHLPGADGFAFVKKLRARSELSTVPVVFLSEQGALEDKLRGLELGVDDYLAKPIFVREVVTRVQLLLARKKQQRIAVEPTARTRFSGSLEDVAVVDVLQTIAVSGKSGVASVTRNERQAWLYFDRGQVIDAEVGDLRGEEAVYRVITWTTGSFDLEFKSIERERVIDAPHQALLMEGLRRVDELGRLSEQLPPENAVVDIDHDALATRLNEIPDELNALLRLIDGKRTLLDLIDASPFDDLSTLTVLSKFYFEGLLSAGTPDPVEWAPGSRPSSAPPAEQARAEAAERASAAPVTLVPPTTASAQAAPPRSAPAAPAATGSRVASSHAPRVVPEDGAPASVADRATVSPSAPEVPASATPTAPPPSTVPGAVEPPREARRQTPAPAAARPVSPVSAGELKLTPKGIVNIGGETPPPSRVAAPASALRQPEREGPRRSPIPMPAGSTPRGGSGSASSHGSGAYPGGLRETRTALGLSAKSLHDTPAVAQRPAAETTPAVPATTPRNVAKVAPAASRSREGSSPQAGSSPRAAAAPAPAVAARADAAVGAPGSNPEPEREFFAAGDHGTYAGGPRSEAPDAPLALDADVRPRSGRRVQSPVHRARARRSMLLVGAILVLAAAPLVVAAWRQLAARTESQPSPEPAALAAPEPASTLVRHEEAASAASDLGGGTDPNAAVAEPSPAGDGAAAGGAPAEVAAGGAAAAEPPAPEAPPASTSAPAPEGVPAAGASAPSAAPASPAPAPNAAATAATPAAPPAAAPAKAPRAPAPRARPAPPPVAAPEQPPPTAPGSPFLAPPAPPLPGQGTPPAPPTAGASPPATAPSPPPPAPGQPANPPQKPKPPTAAFPAP
jgi:DNA-binding response OmpR family regulator